MTFEDFLETNFPNRMSDEHATFTIDDLSEAYTAGFFEGSNNEREIWVQDDD